MNQELIDRLDALTEEVEQIKNEREQDKRIILSLEAQLEELSQLLKRHKHTGYDGTQFI